LKYHLSRTFYFILFFRLDNQQSLKITLQKNTNMNFHLKHHRKLSEVLRIPDGLQDLMADIAREVLRYQPQNIEMFIADYLEAMLTTREIYYVAERTIDDVLSHTIEHQELLANTGISERQANVVMEIIKEEFQMKMLDMESGGEINEKKIIKRLIKECKLNIDQARKASKIIESAWCFYYNQNKNFSISIKSTVPQRNVVQNTLSFYRKHGATVNEFKEHFRKDKICHDSDKAALLIQSWYRGAKVRIAHRKFIEAARKIQATCRGFYARKSVKIKSDDKRKEAAIKIQSWYRASKIHQQYKMQVKSASVIQARFREYMSRKTL
jgi:IQ calmodulin-binding motif